MWHVYIIICSDGSLYTGIAKDVEKRVYQHNKGIGAWYTRSRRPVRLVWWDCCFNKSSALRWEAAIKKMTRKEKWDFIKNYYQKVKILDHESLSND